MTHKNNRKLSTHLSQKVEPIIPDRLIHKGAGKELQEEYYWWDEKKPRYYRQIDLPSKDIDLHLSEIRPGGSTGLHRHMNEALIYVIEGKGYSEIQGRRVEWEKGDAFYIPAWAWHRHWNTDSEKPVLALAARNTKLLEHLGIMAMEERGAKIYSDLEK